MPFVARRQASQDHRLAPGAHAGIGLGALGLGDLFDDRRAAHDQVVQRRVDLVDLAAQVVQIWLCLFHVFLMRTVLGSPKDSFISSLPMRLSAFADRACRGKK